MDWLADGLPTGYRLMAAQATDGKTKILKMYIKIVSVMISLRKCGSFGECRVRENQYKCDVMVIGNFEDCMGQQMRLAKLVLD